MSRKLNRIAQSTAEYAIIIAIVVGAVIAMQIYVRRGIQSRVKDVVDYRGNASGGAGDLASINLFTTNQYEPYYSESNMNVGSNAQRREAMSAGGGVTKQIVGNEVSSRTGTQVTRNQDSAD